MAEQAELVHSDADFEREICRTDRDARVLFMAGMLAESYSRWGGGEDWHYNYMWESARKGCPHAQFAIGEIFTKEGRTESGLVWFEKAAKQGDGLAMARLGRYFREVEKDSDLAFFLSAAIS
jgi:TPR repeat protein